MITKTERPVMDPLTQRSVMVPTILRTSLLFLNPKNYFFSEYREFIRMNAIKFLKTIGCRNEKSQSVMTGFKNSNPSLSKGIPTYA